VNKQKLIIIFLAIVIFIAGWNFGVSKSQRATVLNKDDEQVEKLRKEIDNARKRLEILKHQGAVRTGITNDSTAVKPSFKSSEMSAKNQQALQSESNSSLAAVLSNSKPQTLFDMINAFNSEARNDEWADIREKKLNDEFATDQNLLGTEVKLVECRATLCKVQTRAESKQDAVSTAQKINMLIMKRQNDYFVPHVNVTFNESDKLAVFYLSNDQDAGKLNK
jgi:phosphoketolase